jgi:hypothetical protein
MKANPKKGFVSKLFETLKTLECERIFGLRRIHRLCDLDGFKTTVLKEHSNITKFKSKWLY